MRGRGVPQLPRELETVLVAKEDVDEYHVRPKLPHEWNRLGAGRCNPDNFQPLALEEVSGALEEEGIVVDNEAPDRHPGRIGYRAAFRHPATRHPWGRQPVE